MPLWVADFVGDTMDLDAKEIGAYMLILMTMWGRDGYLPNDDKKLQRVARCGRDWPRVWASIRHYFTVEGDRITQSRLLKEAQKVASKRIVNSQHGSLGGRANALKKREQALANAKANAVATITIPIKKRDTDKSVSITREFEAFWEVVPKRVAKGAARKAFAAAVKRADPQTIIAGMVRYAESRRGQDATYTVHPATWLNADRWSDEAAPASRPLFDLSNFGRPQ